MPAVFFYLLHLADVLLLSLYNTRQHSTHIQTIFGTGDQFRLLILVHLDQFLPRTKIFVTGQIFSTFT